MKKIKYFIKSFDDKKTIALKKFKGLSKSEQQTIKIKIKIIIEKSGYNFNEKHPAYKSMFENQLTLIIEKKYGLIEEIDPKEPEEQNKLYDKKKSKLKQKIKIRPFKEPCNFELTLAEFPIFNLSKKTEIKKNTIYIYQDTIKGRDNKIITRKWTIKGDTELGFGTPSTLSTFFELFQIWKEAKYENQIISFGSIYNLLKRKGIKRPNKEDYKRIKNDLKVLRHINIEAKNAFYDKKLNKYIDRDFNFFDDLLILKQKSNKQHSLDICFIKTSDVLYHSVKKGNILTTDFDRLFFHSLSPMEQRFVLYLTKIFKSQVRHRRELSEFAHQIPIKAKATKKIKQQIKKVTNNLIKKGFFLLKKQDFEKKGKKEYVYFDRIPNDKLQKITYLVEEILNLCGDYKSIGFYRKVAWRMPKQKIYEALSRTRDTAQTGNVKKSKGALFTSIIKKFAKELNIKI